MKNIVIALTFLTSTICFAQNGIGRGGGEELSLEFKANIIEAIKKYDELQNHKNSTLKKIATHELLKKVESIEVYFWSSRDSRNEKLGKLLQLNGKDKDCVNTPSMNRIDCYGPTWDLIKENRVKRLSFPLHEALGFFSEYDDENYNYSAEFEIEVQKQTELNKIKTHLKDMFSNLLISYSSTFEDSERVLLSTYDVIGNSSALKECEKSMKSNRQKKGFWENLQFWKSHTKVSDNSCYELVGQILISTINTSNLDSEKEKRRESVVKDLSDLIFQLKLKLKDPKSARKETEQLNISIKILEDMKRKVSEKLIKQNGTDKFVNADQELIDFINECKLNNDFAQIHEFMWINLKIIEAKLTKISNLSQDYFQLKCPDSRLNASVVCMFNEINNYYSGPQYQALRKEVLKDFQQLQIDIQQKVENVP